MAGRQKNSSGSLAFADDMAGRGCRKNTILANEELLHAISSTNFGDQLNDLGVPEATVTSDDKERS